jgi:CubicO group peptidase (beta-lactamase class C family)
MPARSRLLPSRPSLRYLKLEAKRRLAAGEFPSLHDAQAAVAREHGLPDWAALKQVCGRPQQESHVLPQLRWVIARFSDAGAPRWTAPSDHELRLHFGDRFLTETPAGELIAAITSVAADLREELVIIGQAPLSARFRLAGLQGFASVEADPPHRLTELQAIPAGRPITDTRAAASPRACTLGDVPAEMAVIADEAFAELGLAGLVLAGGGPGTVAWVIARGWADLDRAEVLGTGHRFPAPGVTVLVTATAVLRLVADGRLGLDTSANDHLRMVRLADDTITVRELLSHAAGVDSPSAARLLADSVPDLVTLTGPVVACGGPRGVPQPSNGGCAVLGQLIADVTGSPYADAVTRLVLEPLGMGGSAFPARSADLGPGAVTGYNLTPGGAFISVPAMISTIPAAAGLWATAADLVRLGIGWSTLLPAPLAHEALTAQTAPGPGGRRMGLGWLLSPRGDAAMHAGAGPGATAFLLARVRDNQVYLAMTNRFVSLDPIYARVLRSWTNPAH